MREDIVGAGPNQLEQDFQLAVLDDPAHPPTFEELPAIDNVTARLAYKFQMSGLVAKLYLYLFGEFDREGLVPVIEKVLEQRTVIDQIVDAQVPPLRAIYEFLIKVGYLEDQKLIPAAEAVLDEPDALQRRIFARDHMDLLRYGPEQVIPLKRIGFMWEQE